MNSNLRRSALSREELSKSPLPFIGELATGLVAMTMILGCCRSSAQIIVWGDNSYGQTNAPSDVTNVVALAAGDNHGVALRSDGTVVAWGGNYAGQTNVPAGLTNVVSVAAGSTHSLALRRDGTVAMWGRLYSSFITTVPADATNVVALALGPGSQHGLMLRADGTPIDWGSSYTATIPPEAKNIVQLAAGSASSAALRADGTVIQWGIGVGNNLPPVPSSATNIVALASGWNNFAAIRSDGTILIWGSAKVPPTGFTDVLDLACPMNAILGDSDTLGLMRNGIIMEYNGGTPIHPPVGISSIAAGSYNGLAAVGNGPPIFTGPPINRTVPVQSMAYFRALATGAMPISYQWTCNGTNISGATNSFLAVGPVQPEQTGSAYSLIASNSLGMATNGAMMLFEEPLEATVQPTTLSILPGTNATLTAKVIGQGPFTYQWQVNGTNLDSATNSSLNLTNPQLDQTGAYSVLVTNNYGAVTSSVASIKVLPVIITTQPQSQTVIAGANVSFTVAGTGQQPISYQWLLNGTNVAGETNPTLALTNVQVGPTIFYSVLVSNPCGSVTSSIAPLTVKPLLITSSPGSQNVTVGSSATFSVSANGQSPLSYQWLWNGTNILGETNASLSLTNVQFSQTGNYSVIISNSFGSITSTAPALTISALKITSQPQNQAVLPGANATFSVGVSGPAPFTYQWVCNATNIDAATNSSVTLTNVQLGQTASLFVIISNTYGYTNSTMASLSVPFLLITSQPKDVYVLAGFGASFSVVASSGPMASYQWLFNGTNLPGATGSGLSLTSVKMNQAGLYACIVSNSFGSVTSSPAWLNINPLTISGPLNSSVLAEGATLFSVFASGQPPIFYQWQLNGTNLLNATNSHLQISKAQPNQAGTYTAIVSNQFATLAASAQLVVKPISISSQLQSQVIYRGGNVSFTAGALPGPITYQWQFNGTNLNLPNTNTLSLSNVQYSQAGTYSVTMSNVYGGTNSSASLAVVPVVVFGDIQGSVPGSVSNLLAVAAGGGWDLGLKTDGTVTAWNADPTYVPAGLSNVVAVAAGQSHSMALLADGTITAWGDNSAGQTNVPMGLTNVAAISAAGLHCLALKSDGTVVGWGDNTYGQTNTPPGLTNIVAIAAGYNHSLALRVDGTVIAWGDNGSNQTNVPVGLSNIVGIASGYYHNLALLNNGTVTAWGQDPYGQTDVPAGLSNIVAVACGAYHSLALRNDGLLFAWGYSVHGEATVPPGVTNVVSFGGGYYHSVALLGEQAPPTQAIAKGSGTSGGAFTLQIPSQSGRVYALQYKNSLSDVTWTTLPLTAGNGGTLTLQDPSNTNSIRFYRVSRW